MVWLKRNLFLVLFIAGTLAMTGLAVFFLLNRIAADKKVSGELQTASGELSQMVQANPKPTDENIKIAKDEAQKLADLSAQVYPLLTVEPETSLEPVEYKSLLETTIADLTTEAETLGIDLQSRYSFTFTAQRAMVEFPTNSIGPLTSQLKEIKGICRVLFDAKVHSLDALKRVRAYAEETTSATDYLDGKIVVTNAVGAVITPYLVAFKGFSSELNAVLEGFQESPIFYVVKTLEAKPVSTGLSGMTGGSAAMGMDSDRNVLSTSANEPPANTVPSATSSTSTTQPAQPAAGTTGSGASLKTVLDETPKRFILNLEVVKTFAK